MVKMNKFVKFLFVGGLNTAFGYFIYSLFLYIGFHYALASLFATILGVLFNFKTTGIFVFQSRDNKLLVSFFMVYAVVYGLNIVCLKVFDLFNINLYMAGLVLLLPMAVVSFILMKRFVFKKESKNARFKDLPYL